MCLLALLYRVVNDVPVVAGANREESYARGGEPPQVLPGPRRAVAGLDPQARGTWFGVNQGGLLVAVTNRPRLQVPDRPRSRGLLARDLLGCPDAKAACERAADELRRNRYAGCNVVCADRDCAYVLHHGDRLAVQALAPGVHVLTARDIDDPGDPRLAYALAWLSRRPYDTAPEAVDALKELCARAGDPPICLCGDEGGTVSSSIVALREPLGRSTYLHAQGPPDRTPYRDYSHLLGEIST